MNSPLDPRSGEPDRLLIQCVRHRSSCLRPCRFLAIKVMGTKPANLLEKCPPFCDSAANGHASKRLPAAFNGLDGNLVP
jgi:hypothetical protein